MNCTFCAELNNEGHIQKGYPCSETLALLMLKYGISRSVHVLDYLYINAVCTWLIIKMNENYAWLEKER